MGFASIDADGWQAVFSGVPAGPLILSDVGVARAGFNSAGEAVTYSETLKLTKRIRLPYPDQGTLTGDKVALSDFVYAGDVVPGVINNSAVLSPKPVAKWVSLDRSVVGDSVAPELVAFHRDGIACVEFRATDGATTVTAKVSAAVVLGAATDRNAVIGYRAALDISTLADATNIVVHAKVWPRLGGADSVLDSADLSTRREFSARYYRRHAGAVQNYAYVSTTGNDETAIVSAVVEAARAAPFATVGAAVIAINAAQGPIDGSVIRFMAGTHILANPASVRTQNLAAVTLTRDPDAARAEVILQLGGPATGFNMRLDRGLDPRLDVGCLRIEDVSLVRAGTGWSFGSSSGRWNEVQLVSCSVNMARVSVAMGSRINFYYFGCDITAVHNSSTQSGVSMTHNLWRGCAGDCGGATMDAYLMTGCDFTNVLRMTNGAIHTADGQVIAFNRFQIPGTGGSNFTISAASNLATGYVFAQNLVEALPNTAFPMFQPSADGSSMSTDHVIIIHNSFTGFAAAGRSNLLYNETAGLNRTHVRHRVAGNIHCQLNVKHDVFATDGTHTGGWSHLYGVGCDGEFSMFRDAGSGSFIQEYPGAGANIGTSSTVRNDPLFVDYRAATTAIGVGGGDYQLRADSPAIGRTSREWLPFDLGGKLRTRRVSGALESVGPAALTLLPQKASHPLTSDGGLSVDVGVRVRGGLCPVRDSGARVVPVQTLRRGADGRVLRVDGDSRTLWAGRD